jgi:hypothetical protein
MSRINLGRVVIGGLLAGLIINVGEFILNGVLLKEEMDAAMVALNRPPVDSSMIIWFVVLSFGFAMILVWTYAAIRPRLGAGIKTAICASMLCWGLGYLYPSLFFYVMNLFPRNIIILTSIWGLVEVVVAGIAGAWVYKEI